MPRVLQFTQLAVALASYGVMLSDVIASTLYKNQYVQSQVELLLNPNELSLFALLHTCGDYKSIHIHTDT